jgi:hypothetical protein
MNENNVTQRTIKVKVNLNETQTEAILASMQDAVTVFSLFSSLTCKHKSVSYMTLHYKGYQEAKRHLVLTYLLLIFKPSLNRHVGLLNHSIQNTKRRNGSTRG